VTKNSDGPRGVDAVIRSTAPEPANIRAGYYLRPDQIHDLDSRQLRLRKDGLRAGASLLVRAALDLAAKYPEEWEQLIRDSA
jgi:hypothetical protein